MLYNFMLGTGVRRAEVIGVTVEDIDWETQGLGLPGRVISEYIPLRTIGKALKQYLKKAKSNRVCFRNRSDKLSPSYISGRSEKQRGYRIEKLHPHITRHTPLPTALKAGWIITDLKKS